MPTSSSPRLNAAVTALRDRVHGLASVVTSSRRCVLRTERHTTSRAIVNATADTLRERLASSFRSASRAEESGSRAHLLLAGADLERSTDRLVDLYAAVLERRGWRRRPSAPPPPGRSCAALGTPNLDGSVPARVAARDSRAEPIGLAAIPPVGMHSAIYGSAARLSRHPVLLLRLHRYLIPTDYGVETLLALTTVIGLVLGGITSAFFALLRRTDDEAAARAAESFWFTRAAHAGAALLPCSRSPSRRSSSGRARRRSRPRAGVPSGDLNSQLTALFRSRSGRSRSSARASRTSPHDRPHALARVVPSKGRRRDVGKPPLHALVTLAPRLPPESSCSSSRPRLRAR